MTDVLLEIAGVTVETEAERGRVESAAPVVQEAFRLLAQRLRGTPFEQFTNARAYAIDRIEISALPLDELLSARGAERLADELYEQIFRRRPWPRQ